MNTKNLMSIVKDSVEEKSNNSILKVIDTLLYSGKIKVGNDNDLVNCFNRVAPEVDLDIVSVFREDCEKNGLADGDVLEYTLKTSLEGDFVFYYKLGDNFLLFNKIN